MTNATKGKRRPVEPPGRSCPADYATNPADLRRAADITAQSIYVVGGLYGNAFALDAIEALASAEKTTVQLVFNGDAHWFDAEHDIFADLDRRMEQYPSIAGNIEMEIARNRDVGAGCGCAYPPYVDDGVVERSNAILEGLREIVPRRCRSRLHALPKTLVACVGTLRIGIVHGDPISVAGWRFATEHLDDQSIRTWLNGVKDASDVDVFASTHTCGAVMRDFDLPSGRLAIANNGSAGMSNFSNDRRGLITRISLDPSPHPTAYGMQRGEVFIDALPVAFDYTRFVDQFDRVWPEGSPAAISYRRRILGVHSAADLSRARPIPS
ncbi:hypothetical protein [Pseudorhodoplanes sp.]|uniref:hypothetical protein n=1 Tax=Pseudorhodoplanes sp. TaxID=1934341 RepID=UPI003D12BEA7